ncbi:anti-sigma factor family protein [Streptomyces pathocidini]|uniref:Anti-sigma factor family protein n=1 Tax=Streptomyces pathocidini TaxID=1650571 RepID=A0ABW7UTN3_9ACTN
MTAHERARESASGRGPAHDAVGAYALGVLDPEDAARFEDHLASCDACAEQLEEFMGVEPLLATLAEVPPAAPGGVPDPVAPPVRPGPRMLDALVDEVAAVRRRRRLRGLCLAAAAAALIIGGPAVATVLTAGDDGGKDTALPHAHSTSPAEDAFFHHMTTKRTATDPVTKVTATVGTEGKAWGTHAVLELKNVKGPLKCSLVAVSRTGEREVVTSWSVPAWGYGIPDSPDRTARGPLYVHGGTAMDREAIDHFEVRTFDGDRLVSVDA